MRTTLKRSLPARPLLADTNLRSGRRNRAPTDACPEIQDAPAVRIEKLEDLASQFADQLTAIAPNMETVMTIASGASGLLLLVLRPTSDGSVVLARLSNPTAADVHRMLLCYAVRSAVSDNRCRNDREYCRGAGPGELSPRQTHIIKLLAAGLTYKQIGLRLEIGVETVRTHVKTLCKKLGARTPIMAVAKYSAAGWLSPRSGATMNK